MVNAFPRRKDRKGLTPAEQERLLSQRETIESMGAAQVSEQRRRLRRVRIGLERIVCSSAWFDHNWNGVHMIVESKGVRICKLVSAPYPPGGDASLMKPCRSRLCQGRLYPPNYITSSGHCVDCQERSIHATRRRMGLDESPRRESFIIDQSAMKAAVKAGRDYTGSI